MLYLTVCASFSPHATQIQYVATYKINAMHKEVNSLVLFSATGN